MNQNENLWWVYILKCSDGSYYTGSTTNVDRRVAQHNSGTGAKYTYAHSPVDLVYFESHPNRSLACKRESEIKKLSHSQKNSLVETFHTS